MLTTNKRAPRRIHPAAEHNLYDIERGDRACEVIDQRTDGSVARGTERVDGSGGAAISSWSPVLFH